MNKKSCAPFSPIDAEFRLVTSEGVTSEKLGDKTFVKIAPEVLEKLAYEAFHDASFYLRESHLKQWIAILNDQDTSENERFVVGNLLKNAIIASEGFLPLCQDTGTASVVAKRGEMVFTGVNDEEFLVKGIERVYKNNNLRYSQIIPQTMFSEKNTGNNLPAQIDIGFAPGEEYHFLFMAKGGGSSNKTGLFQASKAMLADDKLEDFLREKIAGLGVAACPPYHLAIVVGGTSPEANLKTLKLATAGALDHLPESGDEKGRPFRDAHWESRVQNIATELGLGAQFGGKWLALDSRVIRLPRHAGSCPISIGVSCSAHRNILAKITSEGAFLEKVERNPGKYSDSLVGIEKSGVSKIDLNLPMKEILKLLEKKNPGDLVLLSGPMVVARDIAHAKLQEHFKETGEFPEYFKNHPVYYAGPAKTPEGMAIGSFGPTTAQRMDGYVDEFMRNGASMVMLAKGNRSPDVALACGKYGGTYLGTIGGAAALLARENIRSSEVIAFPELGMEAIRRIEVENLPAFIISNAEGKTLY